ncbi:MAG: hypothetical protein HZA54_01965, partial [Planctomycetes bacterium]|nr:hypothetical protein [Planctomycetota bacterium]
MRLHRLLFAAAPLGSLLALVSCVRLMGDPPPTPPPAAPAPAAGAPTA